MSPGPLANHKSSKRGPGQVETVRAGTIFRVKKGGLKMETPLETFGFGSQIEEMGFYTPAGARWARRISAPPAHAAHPGMRARAHGFGVVDS